MVHFLAFCHLQSCCGSKKKIKWSLGFLGRGRLTRALSSLPSLCLLLQSCSDIFPFLTGFCSQRIAKLGASTSLAQPWCWTASQGLFMTSLPAPPHPQKSEVAWPPVAKRLLPGQLCALFTQGDTKVGEKSALPCLGSCTFRRPGFQAQVAAAKGFLLWVGVPARMLWSTESGKLSLGGPRSL